MDIETYFTTSDGINFLRLVITFLLFFISVISLFLAIYSLKSQRKHNFNSVRPIGVVHLSSTSDSLSIEIRNKGTGPMYINSLKCVLGEKAENNIVYLIPNELLKIVEVNCHTKPGGEWLSPEESFMIFSAKNYKDMSGEAISEIKKYLKETKMTLIYTDIYEKEHKPFERDLEFLGLKIIS